MKGNRKMSKTVTNIAAQVFDMFNPLGAGSAANFFTPTIADPIVSLAVNKDAFGRPISRENRETSPSPGWERSRDNATKISKALAYGLNYLTGGGEHGIGLVSPTADQLDYIAKEYAGGVGREVTKAARFTSNLISGEETPSYGVPILGKLYGSTGEPSAVADKFYKNIKVMAEFEGEMKRMKEVKANTSQFLKDNPEAKLVKRANYIENEVAKLNREIHAMNKRGAPDKDIKAKKEHRDKVMKAFNDQVSKAQ
jgi:hypothetical protein